MSRSRNKAMVCAFKIGLDGMSGIGSYREKLTRNWTTVMIKAIKIERYRQQ